MRGPTQLLLAIVCKMVSDRELKIAMSQKFQNKMCHLLCDVRTARLGMNNDNTRRTEEKEEEGIMALMGAVCEQQVQGALGQASQCKGHNFATN